MNGGVMWAMVYSLALPMLLSVPIVLTWNRWGSIEAAIIIAFAACNWTIGCFVHGLNLIDKGRA